MLFTFLMTNDEFFIHHYYYLLLIHSKIYCLNFYFYLHKHLRCSSFWDTEKQVTWPGYYLNYAVSAHPVYAHSPFSQADSENPYVDRQVPSLQQYSLLRYCYCPSCSETILIERMWKDILPLVQLFSGKWSKALLPLFSC